MDIKEFELQCRKIFDEAKENLAQNSMISDELRAKFLGRKGELAEIMRKLGELAREHKPEGGKVANELKIALEGLFANTVSQKKIERKFDVTLPSKTLRTGSLHPIRRVMRETIEIFHGMGFSVASGPEIDSEYYNFDALNTPADHPARDVQDTLYLSDGKMLLRSQTSTVQIRVMEKNKPPVKIIAPGRVYRRDTIDPTHYYTFHQCEGLLVDEDVTLADLMGVLTRYAQLLLGKNAKVRFRTHFFPFTEPSIEYDFSCPSCGGKGCRICKNSGWLEISGAGMVDPEVFRAVGYDPEKVRGYAWGMGIERIAMVKYGIDDIRLLYENDLAFLSQFK